MVDDLASQDRDPATNPFADVEDQYQAEGAEMPPVAFEVRKWRDYAKKRGLDRSDSDEVEGWRANAANNSKSIQTGYKLIGGSARNATADDLMYEEIEKVIILPPESGEEPM